MLGTSTLQSRCMPDQGRCNRPLIDAAMLSSRSSRASCPAASGRSGEVFPSASSCACHSAACRARRRWSAGSPSARETPGPRSCSRSGVVAPCHGERAPPSRARRTGRGPTPYPVRWCRPAARPSCCPRRNDRLGPTQKTLQHKRIWRSLPNGGSARRHQKRPFVQLACKRTFPGTVGSDPLSTRRAIPQACSTRSPALFVVRRRSRDRNGKLWAWGRGNPKARTGVVTCG
jgi:hypothetical protein